MVSLDGPKRNNGLNGNGKPDKHGNIHGNGQQRDMFKYKDSNGNGKLLTNDYSVCYTIVYM